MVVCERMGWGGCGRRDVHGRAMVSRNVCPSRWCASVASEEVIVAHV